MANENIGKIKCPFSGGVAYVRRKKSGGGKAPLYIWSQRFGPTFINTQDGQDWILNNAVLYGPEGEPEPAQEQEKPEKIPYTENPDPAPYKGEPEEKPAPAEKPARRSIIDDII